MKKKTTPTMDQWAKLYKVAAKVRDLAPWEWMCEMDLFGVKNPETGETGYISVMGRGGEHYSIAVYLGTKSISDFLAIQDDPDMIYLYPEKLLEIPHLQSSFEDRNYLEKQDRDIIKKLGLKFRGSHAWPQFRSYGNGFFPWYLDAPHVEFLTLALEQLLEVAPRLEEDPDALECDEYFEFLVRVPQKEKDGWNWKDEVIEIEPYEAPPVKFSIDTEIVEKLSKMKKAKFQLEMDFFMVPAPIADKGKRPYFPYNLLLVDSKSGMILGIEMLTPLPSLEEMWSTVPQHVFSLLTRFEALPEVIKIRSPLLLSLISPVAEDLKIKVKETSSLPMLDEARQSMMQFMGR